MNSDLINRWHTKEMLGEILLAQHEYKRKNKFVVDAYTDRYLDFIKNKYLDIKHTNFSMYPQQGGMARLRNRHMMTINNFLIRHLENKTGRTSWVLNISNDVSAKKRERRQYDSGPTVDVNVKLSWGLKVWKRFYNENSALMGNLVVLDADGVRYPNRNFDFFKVIYYEIGAKESKKGLAAKSRLHPEVIAIVPEGKSIIEVAERKLADYVTEKLFNQS